MGGRLSTQARKHVVTRVSAGRGTEGGRRASGKDRWKARNDNNDAVVVLLNNGGPRPYDASTPPEPRSRVTPPSASASSASVVAHG